MIHKKLFAVLLGLCVLLAPVLGNTALLQHASATQSQDQAHDCHTVNHSGDAHSSNAKTGHNCCFNFVGSVPVASGIQPHQITSEIIPFNPSLSLAFRVEGLFRPPRQLS